MVHVLLDIGIFGLLTSTIAAILALIGLVHFLRDRPSARSGNAQGASTRTAVPRRSRF